MASCTFVIADWIRFNNLSFIRSGVVHVGYFPERIFAVAGTDFV
jgi:hypothetical protein